MGVDLIQLKTILIDYEDRHSEFQIENFIIRSSGCEWFQYKQALREIDSRANIIVALHDEKKAFEFPRYKLFFLKTRRKSQLKIIEKKIFNVEAELKIFLRIAEKLKKQIGEITPERRNQLETESWKNKGIKMAAIDILATGRISNQTYDFVFSLPKESQLEIFKTVSAIQPMGILGFEPDEIRAITKK